MAIGARSQSAKTYLERHLVSTSSTFFFLTDEETKYDVAGSTNLFDWFGLVFFVNKNKSCQLSYS
jgi:hypothetical protein